MTNYMKNPQLDGESFFFEGDQTGILLLHGFTASTAEVRLLADSLREHGYTISAPLLPGHGTHPDDLNQRRWMEWYQTAEDALLTLKERCERVFVGGESMGALLSLLLASRRPELMEGLMLYAPAMHVKNLGAAHLLRYFMKYLDKNQKEDGLAWKGYNVYPLRAAVELLKLQKIVKAELKNVTQPIIIFLGELDKTISPESGERILNSVRSSDTRLVRLKESPHCLLLASEIDQVADETRVFIEQHASCA